MKKSPRQEAGQSLGFTLIELSIVLVIIGLIVGGVLVGQDLIKAAEVRSVVGQVEKYNAAVNTFRTKFNGIPGDIVSAQASAFGLCPGNDQTGCITGAAGLGDGNGLLDSTASINNAAGEVLTFWQHMSSANLLDGGTFGSDLTTAGAAGTPANPSLYLPAAKISAAGRFIVFSTGGLNFYEIMPIATVASPYTYTTGGLTPIESFNIDGKTDDGSPNTGVVLARANGTGVNNTPTFAATTTAGRCNIGDGTATTDTYNRVQGSGGNDRSCALSFRFN